MCPLYNHLTDKKISAWTKGEHHEIMRMNREIREHVAKCAECKDTTLEEQLFRRPVVVTWAEVKS